MGRCRHAILPFAFLWAVLFAFIFRRINRAQTARRLKSYFREQLGADEVPCIIELRPETIWVRQGTVEISFPWSDATAIEEVPEGIELWFRGSALLMARSRAFASAEQREAFLARARELSSAAGRGD